VNPKDLASPSSGNPSELMRKVNEPCRYPHQFCQTSSSSPPEIDSSSQSGDAIDGVPNDSDSPSLPESPSKKEELKEKGSSDSENFSSSKYSSSHSSSEKIQMPSPPFPHRIKKNDQDHIEKMRETFPQVKINISLLDAIQQLPSYAKFLKDLCTTKRATGVPKKIFLTSSANSILSHQISGKYKDLDCPTVSIVIGDQLIHITLLDLGASVNLIPFTEYERLELGELKPTKMVI